MIQVLPVCELCTKGIFNNYRLKQKYHPNCYKQLTQVILNPTNARANNLIRRLIKEATKSLKRTVTIK